MLVYFMYAAVTGHLCLFTVAILSVIGHEAAHALASTLLGARPSRVELTPMGAVLHQEDEILLSPMRRVVVLVAGPLCTLLLCWLAIILTQQGLLGIHIGRWLFVSNLGILLINLLPALPLDGGRLLLLLLQSMMPLQRACKVMVAIGKTIGIGLIVANIWCSYHLGGWNFSLGLAGCCILYGTEHAVTTRAMEELRALIDRKIRLERQRTLPMVWLAVLQHTPVRKLITAMPSNCHTAFMIIEEGSQRCIGWVDESEVIQAYLSNPEISCANLAKNLDKKRKNDNI